MGEKYLGQLTAKSAPATGDIMVLEDSEDTKKIDYDALANAILNKLTTKTYTVAGGSNTLIAAIDALNSNAYLLNGATLVPINSDLNTYTTAGNYQIKFTSDANTISNMPVKTAGVLKVEISGYASNNYKRQTFYEFNNSNRHIRYTNDNGNTWSTWEQVPTRDEINTLNSKTNGTLLWSGSTTLDGGTITLSSPVTNFTWLLFVFKTNNEIATCIMKADHATTERPYAIIQAGEWVTDANRFRYCAWCSLTKTSDTTYDVTCKYNNQNFICKPGAVWGF